MVSSPSTACSSWFFGMTRVDMKERVGNFSTSRKSALFKCASRCASRVFTDAASMLTSTFDLVTSPSWRSSVPESPENWPFTFEIIMCLTLNSATECAGSMAQVVTAFCGAGAVDMVSAPCAAFGLDACPRYSLQRLVQKNNLGFATGSAEQFTKSLEPLTPQVPQLLAVPVLDRLVKSVQHAQSFRRNPRQDHAPVFDVTPSRNQDPLLQSIKQSRDVGIPSDHAFPDFAARQTFQCAAQDAQHVVLRRR